MYRKILIATAAAALFVAPALAATTYYVELNTKTNKCLVTAKKPSGSTLKMVGTAGYHSKTDAETALKAAAECKA